MNEHVDYQSKEAGPVTRFLWWCAGADPQILRYSSYSDHVKYEGIGGVVLATGVLAALSMGFAMHTIFNEWLVTLPIAIGWALIVFNLDRFIVSSTGKGDGESGISFMELVNAFPRLFMAVLLGLTISAPLETKIFSIEIEREWVDTKKELIQKRLIETKNQKRTTGEIAKSKAQFDLDSIRLAEKEKIYLEKQNIIENITSGLNGFDRCTRGASCPRHKEYYSQRDLAKLERDSAQANYTVSKNKLIEAEQEETDKLNQEVTKIDTMTSGFLDQIMMLEKLSAHSKDIPEYDPLTNQAVIGSNKEVYGAAFWPIWLVRLLFMIIEIAPVILKLMLIKGPYDYMSENVNQILETKQGISVEHVPDGNNKIQKLKRNHNPERIIAIIEHQNKKEAENAREAITRFAEKEKEEIRKNPEDFIKPNS